MPAKKPRVRVRTYRHGLGDCHLLRFRKPDGKSVHVLIDFGVVNRTKNPDTVMKPVAKDIAKESGGVLDLVIATHQHTDHLSGFKQAQDELDPTKVEMKRLWLAWTEDPSNPLGKKVKDDLVAKLTAVRLAAKQLAAADSAAAARIQGTLDFFSPGVAGEDTQEILDALQARPDVEIEYHSPGDLLELPGVPNVRVYVLGPPSDTGGAQGDEPAEDEARGLRGGAARRRGGGLRRRAGHDAHGSRGRAELPLRRAASPRRSGHEGRRVLPAALPRRDPGTSRRS